MLPPTSPVSLRMSVTRQELVAVVVSFRLLDYCDAAKYSVLFPCDILHLSLLF